MEGVDFGSCLQKEGHVPLGVEFVVVEMEEGYHLELILQEECQKDQQR